MPPEDTGVALRKTICGKENGINGVEVRKVQTCKNVSEFI